MLEGLDPSSDDLPDWDCRRVTTDDMENFITSVSKGLAELTESNFSEVQFIHESVKDFLIKDEGLYELWPDLGTDLHSTSHDKLKQCCQAYISRFRRRGIASFEAIEATGPFSRFPLFDYAFSAVFLHSEEAAFGIPQDDFLRSFDFQSWKQSAVMGSVTELSQDTSLLYILAQFNYPRLIATVLRDSPEIDVKGGEHEYPLLAAAWRGNLEAVQALLQGAESHPAQKVKTRTEVRGRYGLTALLLAVKEGHIDLVELLCEMGADTEARANDGRTALMYTTEGPGSVLLRVLLENGANIDAKDNQGWTALMHAVSSRMVENVEELLNRGADVFVVGKEGETAWTIATSRRAEPRSAYWARLTEKEILGLLLAKGAGKHEDFEEEISDEG